MDLFRTKGAALLVEAILSLKNEAECRAFLEDVMTGKEIQDCGQRLLVAQLLSRQMVYSRIAEITGASSATISRVNRCLKHGKGYRQIIERMFDQNEGED